MFMVPIITSHFLNVTKWPLCIWRHTCEPFHSRMRSWRLLCFDPSPCTSITEVRRLYRPYFCQTVPLTQSKRLFGACFQMKFNKYCWWLNVVMIHVPLIWIWKQMLENMKKPQWAEMFPLSRAKPNQSDCLASTEAAEICLQDKDCWSLGSGRSDGENRQMLRCHEKVFWPLRGQFS